MSDRRVRVVFLGDRRIGAREIVGQENVTARRRREHRTDADMRKPERAGTRKVFLPAGQGTGEKRVQIVDAERRVRGVQPRGRNILSAGAGIEPVHPRKTGARAQKFRELDAAARSFLNAGSSS